MELTEKEMSLLKEAYRTMSDTWEQYHPEAEADLYDFERLFESIPIDYRYLLKEFGGCHFVDPWIFAINELKNKYPDFIAGYSENGGGISAENVFPVGGLGDGSIVCIIKETGKIAILPHDVFVETIDDLEIIANSFKELILDLAEQGIEIYKQTNS